MAFKGLKKVLGVMKKMKLKQHRQYTKDLLGDKLIDISMKNKKGKEVGGVYFNDFPDHRFVGSIDVKKFARNEGLGRKILEKVIQGRRTVTEGAIVSDEGMALRRKFNTNFRYKTEVTSEAFSEKGKKIINKNTGKATYKKSSKPSRKVVRFIRHRGRIIPIHSKRKK